MLADPGILDPGRRGEGRIEVGRGFRLGAGSPAIGVGTAIGGGPRRDYFGNPLSAGAPAIGAHQPG